MIDAATISFDAAGLIPAVVQDAATARVLMVAYMDRAALAATIDSGEVHFFSRSRRELWRKGATSGNTLALVRLDADCDRDALLVTVRPAGPACHTGAVSCFSTEAEPQGFAGLEALWATIRSRIERRPAGSYTTELVRAGVDGVGRKVLEEAGEVLLAAKDHAQAAGSAARVSEEAADLLFHLLVLLAERDIAPQTVMAELAARASR